MNFLLESDSFIHVINFLSIDSIVSLSETRKDMKEILLEKINKYIIPCGSLIEYVALISERKYTIYSKDFCNVEFFNSDLVHALAKIEDIDIFKGDSRINSLQPLFELKSLGFYERSD